MATGRGCFRWMTLDRAEACEREDTETEHAMRIESPPLVPGFDIDVYVVLDDFGDLGRVYREAEEEAADRETVIRHLMEGQFNNPVRIVAFNSAQGWARDVTLEILQDIRNRDQELSPGLRAFIEQEFDRAERWRDRQAPAVESPR
jgi:hypothetical protein